MNKDYPFIGTKKGKSFEYITYGDFGNEVNKFRGVLKKLNVGVNDKVGIISVNRVEFAVAYYGSNGVGAQIVPMYEAQVEKDWKHIISDSETKLLIVSTEEIYEKTKSYVKNFANVEAILCLDASVDKPYSYQRHMNAIQENEIPPPLEISDDHVATVIYTSGTTGQPKGVELTHGNITSNLKGLRDLWGLTMPEERDQSLCFIPWSHIFGMTCALHAVVAHGSATALVSKREEILESFDIAQPVNVSSVPLILNRIYNGVYARVASSSPFRQKLFHGALAICRERNHRLEFGQPVNSWLEFKFSLVDKLIMSKIRAKLLGGKLKYLSAGGSKVSLEVLQFFEDVGLPIVEGYGLTETSPIVAAGTSPSWEYRRLGCVGVLLDNMLVKFIDPVTLKEVGEGEVGEICCAGPSVTKGYRNNDEANRQSFLQIDGVRYFRTGDLGQMVEKKFLKITGRIKEQYKLENGKYIVPAPIEDTIGRSQYISQVMVYGSHRPYNVAFIVPDVPELSKWCIEHQIPVQNLNNQAELDELLTKPKIIQLYNEELIKYANELKKFERVMKWLPLSTPFTQENQFLTAKMSIRRNNIVKAYEDKLTAMYEDKAGYSVSYPN